MTMIPTRERWRSRLPHWEVDGHWHFVTIRCQGSLPNAVKQKLQEIHQSLQTIQPQSEEFLQLQRRYFIITEKYLDASKGIVPFLQSRLCELCLKALINMATEGWLVGEATIMPNHVHLLIRRQADGFSLRQVIMRFKGRAARWINQELGRSGRFWQEDWFDRWMRDDGEWARAVAYIRNNPVKAGLVENWGDYPWRISTDIGS